MLHEPRRDAIGRLRQSQRELLEEGRREAKRDAGDRGEPLGRVVRLCGGELPDADETLLAERREIDRRHQRAQGDVRADVRRRLRTTDVLLAGLEREHEPARAVDVHRGADQSPGHAPHEVLLRAEHAEVRTAERERNAEALPLADHDVRALRARRREHAEIHGLGADDQQRPGGVGDLRGGGHVFETAVEVRCLEDQRRGRVAAVLACRLHVEHAVGRRHVAEANRRPLAVRRDHAPGERIHATRHDDLRPSGRRVRHQRGFGQRRGAVVDRRVRDVHAGQFRDHRLVFVDGPERPLAGFGLVRRVGGEELAAQDQVVDRARDVVVVGAGAEEAHVGIGVGVLRRERAHVTHQVHLGDRGTDGERPRQARLFRHPHEQVLDRSGADRPEHLALFARGGRQVPHQWPPSARNCSYCCAVSNCSHSPRFDGAIRIIQPRP